MVRSAIDASCDGVIICGACATSNACNGLVELPAMNLTLHHAAPMHRPVVLDRVKRAMIGVCRPCPGGATVRSGRHLDEMPRRLDALCQKGTKCVVTRQRQTPKIVVMAIHIVAYTLGRNNTQIYAPRVACCDLIRPIATSTSAGTWYRSPLPCLTVASAPVPLKTAQQLKIIEWMRMDLNRCRQAKTPL